MANAVLNKTICAYIINNYCLNVPKKIKYLQPHLTTCVVGNIPVCLSLLGKRQPCLIITTTESPQFMHDLIKYEPMECIMGKESISR